MTSLVKKIAAILLMSILLFNLFGYRMAVDFLQQKADSKLEARLDNKEYDESQLIEIKVALNMPYQQRYTEFERHYGEVVLDGKSYTYVKSRVDGDMLILKCIPNQAKEASQLIKNDVAKSNSAADMDHSGKNSQQKSFAKNSLGEYDDQLITLQSSAANNSTISPYASYESSIPEGVTSILQQPPRSC